MISRMFFTPETIWNLWENVTPNLTYMNEIQFPAIQILNRRGRYAVFETDLGVPWYIIGCIHYRESSFNFKTWLCNGDHLFDSDGKGMQTIHVPGGLGPVQSWEEGAKLSFKHVGWNSEHKWDIVNALIACEKYNGLGYRILRANNGCSPYLWSMTNYYTSGKFGSDGKFDSKLIDKQAGIAAILWYLARKCNVDVIEKEP